MVAYDETVITYILHCYLRMYNQFLLRMLHVAIYLYTKLASGATSAFYTRRFVLIGNGNRTEWSPIRSVIIRMITKSDDRAAGVRFVYQEYDYRLNWTTRSLIIN